jgi:methylated-DNA-[protein]-cysteine S-methyltransferase
MFESAYIQSPIGILEISGSNKGIKMIRVCTELHPITEDIPMVLRPCVQQLTEYFEGQRNSFHLKLDLEDAPPFYRDVWNVVSMIPYGKTRSYSDIAQILDSPKAVRAIGQANGKNPIPIVIPCHRVVGKNGDLTGYAYGIPIKRQLLHLENPVRYAEQGVLF